MNNSWVSPIRWMRSWTCVSAARIQCGVIMKTWFACIRVRPWPPNFSMISSPSIIEAGPWNLSTTSYLASGVSFRSKSSGLCFGWSLNVIKEQFVYSMTDLRYQSVWPRCVLRSRWVVDSTNYREGSSLTTFMDWAQSNGLPQLQSLQGWLFAPAWLFHATCSA